MPPFYIKPIKRSSSLTEQMLQHQFPPASPNPALPTSCSSSTAPNCCSREHRDLSFPKTPLHQLSLFLC